MSRKTTFDERSMIVNALELKWASVNRAIRNTNNDAVKIALEVELNAINALQRDINNVELFS